MTGDGAASGRLPALDGVRALAILLVLAGHFGNIPGLAVAGVELFFVLSGFLITRLLAAEQAATGTIRLRRFYWRRACRIVPAYLLWVGVTWLILGHPGLAGDRRSLVGLLTYTYNYVTPGAYGFSSIIHPAWSLSVEEQFYLLWPLGLLLVGLRRGPRALLALFGAVLAWRLVATLVLQLPHTYLDWAFETNACTLALGCWLALHSLRGGSLRWTRYARPWWVTIAVGILLAGVCLGLQDVAAARAWAVPLSALIMLLVLSLALARGSGTVLAHPFARWVGAISYPLYLWHLWGLAVADATGLPAPVRPLLAVAASVGLASLSYYLLERPILRWRDAGHRPARAVVLQNTGSS